MPEAPEDGVILMTGVIDRPAERDRVAVGRLVNGNHSPFRVERCEQTLALDRFCVKPRRPHRRHRALGPRHLQGHRERWIDASAVVGELGELEWAA